MGSKRDAILEAATWLFSVKGYQDASTTDVARLTGSADGTVFYHFESKEKLFMAVLEEVKASIERSFADFLPSTTDMAGLEMLESLTRFFLKLAEENKAAFMLLHRHHAYGLAAVNEDCRALLEAIYDRFLRTFEDAIRRGREDGTMGELDVQKTAVLVFVMVDGLVRLKHYQVCQTGSLFEEFLAGLRRLVAAKEVTR